MCVIIGMAKDQVVPFAKLKNATLNNPHGFGIVTVTGDKMSVFKKFDEKGNDPELVAKELDKRADADMRYIHLRYRTRGLSNKENTHPFTVFNRDGHRIEFMHNGGLQKHTRTDETEKSDSRQFAENFLTPMLAKFHGENGPADTEDVHLEEFLETFFSFSNRGLLISNKFEPMFLGKWETTDDVDGNKLIVSNTDYFGLAQNSRMTEFYKPKTSDIPRIRQQQQQNQQQARQGTLWGNNNNNGGNNEEQYPLGTAGTQPASKVLAPITTPTANTSQNSTSTEATGTEVVKIGGKKKMMDRDITQLKEVDLKKTGRFLNHTDLEPLFDTHGAALDDELIGIIAMCTLSEFRGYVDSNPDGASRLLEHLFLRCELLISDNEELIGKNLRASQMIASLKGSSMNACAA